MKKYKVIIRTLCLLFVVGTLFTACSDDSFEPDPYGQSGVNLLGFGPTPILRTNEIRITGTNMQNVDQVIFPGADPITRSGFNSSDEENIYVNVPDESVPGEIKLVAGKDTVTSVTKITFEEPIEVTSITPTSNLNAGDIITIKGEYVYNIATVTFTAGVDVNAEDFVKVSRKEVQVKVPLAAESGPVTLTDGADWTLEYKTPLEIIGASVSEVTPTSTDFGQIVTIKGVNLHTVTSVMFSGGVESTFTLVNNNTITATVPADAKSGAITLTTASGATVSTSEVTVPEVTITGCSKTEDICSGDEITVTGQNFDRITQVFLGSEELASDKYTVTGSTSLTFTVPDGMGDCDLKLVQNANIAPTQTLAVRKLANVIWQGKETLDSWGNWGVFSWSGDLWTTFQSAFTGAGKMTVHFVQTKDNPQFNFKMGDWSTSFSSTSPAADADGIFRPAAGVEDLEVNLSADEVDQMFGSGAKGLVIWGDGIQVQYIKFVAAGAEQIVWEGIQDMGEWSNQPYIGSDTAPELSAVGAAEGNVIRFYVTPTADDWQFQAFEGHWGPQYGSWAGAPVIKEDGSEDTSWTIASDGVCKITLTQEMLDKAYTQQWWGGIWVVQGKHCILTKVTCAPM